MPSILDNDGREVAVDAAQLKQLRRQVESDQRDMVVQTADEHDGKVPMWDFIDQNWTSPLPIGQVQNQLNNVVYQAYLDKVVIKCSACKFTTAFDNGVSRHLDLIRKQTVEHSGAVIRETETGVRLCSGCGCTFHSRPGRAQRHIDQMVELADVHQGRIEALHMRRYGLAPSEPIILRREVVDEGSAVDQMERDAPVPSASVATRRKTRRRRRRANGNGYSGVNGTAPLG